MSVVKERSTRQKAVVASLLESESRFRSALDLYAQLRTRGETIGLTTVYRSLQSMVEAGKVDVLRIGAETLYRCCSREPHYHVVCRSCGYTVEVAEASIGTWARDVAVKHGYRHVSHVVDVIGVCSACGEEGGMPG